MPHSRRSFLRMSSIAPIAAISYPFSSVEAVHSLKTALKEVEGVSPRLLAEDETFWYYVQKSFKQTPKFINLENGYFCCQPLEVLDSQQNHIQMINEMPSYYMRRHQWPDRRLVKAQLADFAGCSVEEIAITRNTTESLNTVIAGLDFKAGDEAILCDQDYGSMQQQLKQQSQRQGLALKWVNIPLHPTSDEEIVQIYKEAITPKTRIMLVSHVINITGHVLPVRKIADMAHDHGVEVICDGAHSFGHLDYNIPDLGCDYFGTSLHKWLCCPLGSGLLYIKKDRIAQVWPLFGDVVKKADDIRKFEHQGTQPISTHLTIANALKFQQMIGSERKQERLRYLRNYWVERVKDLPHVTINSPLEWERSCAIGNVAVKGMSPSELEKYLFEKHNIFTVSINRESVKGIRVTPHLYTTISDLDTFVAAIQAI